MSEITRISDYRTRLLALLLGQFRTGTNWGTLFTALADTGAVLQEQEDTVFSLWQQRANIDLAAGRQLDQWGALLGLSREGWGDTSYAHRIRVWLQVLRSKGTPDELIQIAADLAAEAVSDVLYWETPPATYSLQVAGGLYASDPARALDVARYVSRAAPAGVGVGQIITLDATPLIFGDADNGFSTGKFSSDASQEAGI